MAGAQITLEGVEATTQRLNGVAERCRNVQAVAPMIFRELEQAERPFFAGGHDVQTGRTMRSLTEPDAPGAIREITGEELTFGTSIWYSRFLGPEMLRISPITAERAARLTLDHIVGRRR